MRYACGLGEITMLTRNIFILFYSVKCKYNKTSKVFLTLLEYTLLWNVKFL